MGSQSDLFAKDGGLCKKCGAAIVWVTLIDKHGAGKPHPLDAEPRGQSIVRFGQGGAQARITRTWTSHFETCPEADHFRDRRAE